MSSQADFLKVTEHVIRPLERHYGKAFDADTISDFVDDLAKYSPETLKKAMTEVRQNEMRRPNIATIIAAIKKNYHESKSNHAPADGWLQKKQMEYEAQDRRARKSSEDYFENFVIMNSERLKKLPRHFLAKAENCIFQAAHLQAQMLEGIKNCGYQTPVSTSEENWEERLRWWKAMCHRAADAGMINVEVPWGWYETKIQEAA